MKVIAGQASSEAWLKLLSSRLFSQSFSEDVESFCIFIVTNLILGFLVDNIFGPTCGPIGEGAEKHIHRLPSGPTARERDGRGVVLRRCCASPASCSFKLIFR
jgi:hypothetical protein